MPATICFKFFCLPVCCLRIIKMKIYRFINEAFESSGDTEIQHFVRPVLTVLTAVGSTPSHMLHLEIHESH
jgi:hypothetical protein